MKCQIDKNLTALSCDIPSFWGLSVPLNGPSRMRKEHPRRTVTLLAKGDFGDLGLVILPNFPYTASSSRTCTPYYRAGEYTTCTSFVDS